MSNLPVNLDELIHARQVESVRIEYKSTWDENIKQAVMKTICAYANDLQNINGGYIIIGIKDEKGLPVLPPEGLEGFDLEQIQREIRISCTEYIEPDYIPYFSPEIYLEKNILVIWAPAGDNRPYQCFVKPGSKERAYFVRIGAETIKAEKDILTRLISMTAKIPYDDRRNLESNLNDIDLILVKSFLNDVRSGIVFEQNINSDEILKKLRLIVPSNSKLIPRNIALLFFNEHPENFFPCAKIEIAQFRDHRGGDLIEEKTITGPLNLQIKKALEYLNNIGEVQVQKIPGQAEAERTVAYPYEAMEETIVNAIFHRGYDYPPDPIKIYLYPTRMEITSYPGPVDGINSEHFLPDNKIPEVPYRNRRIGDFLKDLHLAEKRGTGIPKIRRKMEENGSPAPIFQFDDKVRNYITVILPVHPKYLIIHSIRESAHLWATGKRMEAIKHLQDAYNSQPENGWILSHLIEYLIESGKNESAMSLLYSFKNLDNKIEEAKPFIKAARIFLNRDRFDLTQLVLPMIPIKKGNKDKLDEALLYKRTGDYSKACNIYEEIYNDYKDDPIVNYDLAITKLRISKEKNRKGSHLHSSPYKWPLDTRKKLTKEAIELLRRAIQLFTDKSQIAWSWFEIANAMIFLKHPESQIEEAYKNAISYAPFENIFTEKYKKWKSKNQIN